jgi:hypothetical protein
MSSAYLIVASPDDAHAVALEFSERRWPNLSIDPYDTALHVLVARLTNRTFEEVLATLHDRTPKLEGAETAEPWDEQFWVACIYQLPADYINTIVSIRDNEIPQLVSWWYSIEAFEWNRTHGHNFTEQSVEEDLRRIRDFLVAAEKQSVLMRHST